MTELTLNLHHLPHTVTAVLGDGSDLGARIRYSWEQPELLGSAGGPRRALDIVGSKSFFVVNGDTLTDVPMDLVGREHQRAGALVTLALVHNREPRRYGGVLLSDAGVVTGFVRKGEGAIGSYHFIGVQAVNRAAFEELAIDQPVNSIGAVYDRLIASQPGSIRGVVTTAGFWDVGTVADYVQTSWHFLGEADYSSGAGTRVAPSARVVRSILWDNVEVGAGAVLDRCIVTDGVLVRSGAVHHRVALTRTADGRTESTDVSADFE